MQDLSKSLYVVLFTKCLGNLTYTYMHTGHTESHMFKILLMSQDIPRKWKLDEFKIGSLDKAANQTCYSCAKPKQSQTRRRYVVIKYNHLAMTVSMMIITINPI